MSDRIEGCRVPFGSSEYIKMIPVCMDGDYLSGGCPQEATCQAWKKYGRGIVENAQTGFGDVLVEQLPNLRGPITSERDLLTSKEFASAAHQILDLAISQYEAERLEAIAAFEH